MEQFPERWAALADVEAEVPPTVGVAASLVVLALLVVPYLVVESGSGVGTYYTAGLVNPLVVGLFALVAVVVYAAGREGRSEADLVAGVALALGWFMFVLALLWALTVPESVVTQLEVGAAFQYHRWLLVVATLSVPASAAWYARVLGII